MKKFNFTFIAAILTFAILFNACSDSEGPTVPNNGGNTLKGAYILYGSTNTTDYAYYDAVKDSVSDFVYSASNPGRSMIVNPGEMRLNSDRKFYITALGIPNSPGTIYKIDPDNNSMIDSLHFGINPNGFTINNNKIIVSNSGGSTVSILDLDLNLLTDTIQVGSAPNDVLYAYNRYIVSRMPANTENSLAIINETGYEVSKLFFPGVPVSSIYNVNGIFTSTLNSKNVYMIGSESFTTIDSFSVPTIFSFINKIEFKTQNSFYAVAGGREVWLATAGSGTFIYTNIYPPKAGETIQTIAYEPNANELYLGVWNGASFLVIIDGSSGVIKRTRSLSGLGAASIVFRY